MPRHATVVPPGRLVSSPLPLLPSVLLFALLELALAMVLLPEELGFSPQACSRAVELGFVVMCEIHAL
jgi:hypothetical protein